MTHIGNQNEEKRVVSFMVVYQADFNHAVVVGLLDALGLKTAALLEGFSNQFYKGSFPEICLRAIRKDRYLLSRDLAIAKKVGQVLIKVEVAVSILKEIAAYLTSISADLTNRVTDSVHQAVSGNADALRGAMLNVAEGGDDQIRGIGNIVQGGASELISAALTSTTGAPSFYQGWSQLYKGLGQFGRG